MPPRNQQVNKQMKSGHRNSLIQQNENLNSNASSMNNAMPSSLSMPNTVRRKVFSRLPRDTRGSNESLSSDSSYFSGDENAKSKPRQSRSWHPNQEGRLSRDRTLSNTRCSRINDNGHIRSSSVSDHSSRNSRVSSFPLNDQNRKEFEGIRSLGNNLPPNKMVGKNSGVRNNLGNSSLQGRAFLLAHLNTPPPPLPSHILGNSTQDFLRSNNGSDFDSKYNVDIANHSNNCVRNFSSQNVNTNSTMPLLNISHTKSNIPTNNSAINFIAEDSLCETFPNASKTNSNVTKKHASPYPVANQDVQSTQSLCANNEPSIITANSTGENMKIENDGFQNEIDEEMKRAKQMSIPVNINNNPTSSKLNPFAGTFNPSLKDSNGNDFVMRQKLGTCYFIPKDQKHESNPAYMVRTSWDSDSTSDRRDFNNTFDNFENLTINSSQESLNSIINHQNTPPATPGNLHNIFNFDSVPQTFQSRHPTDQKNNDHIQNAQGQEYLNDRQNGISNNESTPYTRDIYTNGYGVCPQILPALNQSNCQYNTSPMSTMNFGKHDIQPQGGADLVPSPRPINGYNLQGTTMNQVIHPNTPLGSPVIVVGFPNQNNPAPLVGYHSLSPFYLPPHPISPLTPISENQRTPNYVSSPPSHFTPFIFGQADLDISQMTSSPPVMDFQAYMGTIDNSPSESILNEKPSPPSGSTNFVNKNNEIDKETIPKSLKCENYSLDTKKNTSESNKELIEIVSKFLDTIKRFENESEVPLSKSQLLEKILGENTETLFGVQSGQVTASRDCLNQNISPSANHSEINKNSSGSSGPYT